MKKNISNRFKIIYVSVFVLLNTLNCFLLTTNLFLKDLTPYPRNIFMFTNSFFGDFGLMIVLVSLALILCKNDYRRMRFLMGTSIVLSILYFGLTVYFGYYGMMFSFYNLAAFASPGGGDAFVFLLASVPTLLTYSKPFFLLSAVVMVVLFVVFVRRHRKNPEIRQYSFISKSNRFTIGFSVLLIGVLVMANSLSAYRVEIDDTWYEDNTTPLYGAETVGLLNYYLYDAYSYFFTEKQGYSDQKRAEIEAELEAYRAEITASPIDGTLLGNSEYEGLFAGKNLLLIQIESMNNFVIGLKVEVDGEWVEVTPNLNAMLADSVYFNNYYTNVGIGNTSDAEFTVLTGLYPVGPTYTVFEYAQVQYPTLPKMFKAAGYSTFSAHANTGIFYERSTLHPSLYGFDYHYAEEDFEITEDQLIHTWLNDHDFLMENIDLMQAASASGPVFSFAITISDHMPYRRPTDVALEDNWFPGKTNLLPAGYRVAENDILNEQFVGYLEHVSYTDYAIGAAMDYLETAGLAEDTIVVLYGDHGCGIDIYDMFYESPDQFSNDLNGIITDTGLDTQILLEREMLTNIPFIIYDPSYDETTSVLKAQTVSLTRGSNCTTRTIASLFGLDQEYYFGTDALSDQRTFTYNPRNLDIFVDGAIISGTSQEFVVTDEAMVDFYTPQKVIAIIDSFLEYKDFNDKLLRYEIFPPLE
ncbi:MAG TPA: hypothetical protein DD618_01495 [Acholeplasmatales bacterium]|nr:hypothetical protein [Acholeplasmatales bacterium]